MSTLPTNISSEVRLRLQIKVTKPITANKNSQVIEYAEASFSKYNSLHTYIFKEQQRSSSHN